MNANELADMLLRIPAKLRDIQEAATMLRQQQAEISVSENLVKHLHSENKQLRNENEELQDEIEALKEKIKWLEGKELLRNE